MSVEREESLVAALLGAFPFLEGRIEARRERRIWADVDLERFREVFDRAAGELGFGSLCVITGLDEGDCLGFIYHLAKDSGIMLSIHTKAPKAGGRIPTVTDRFPSAHIYERELVDLFGAEVEGLPPGKRYPLPDGWPEGEHPLLKDWKPAGSEAANAAGDEAGGREAPGEAD